MEGLLLWETNKNSVLLKTLFNLDFYLEVVSLATLWKIDAAEIAS